MKEGKEWKDRQQRKTGEKERKRDSPMREIVLAFFGVLSEVGARIRQRTVAVLFG